MRELWLFKVIQDPPFFPSHSFKPPLLAKPWAKLQRERDTHRPGYHPQESMVAGGGGRRRVEKGLRTQASKRTTANDKEKLGAQ